MKTTTLYTEKVITAGQSLNCPNIVNLRQTELGVFSIQVVLTGDGTLEVEYLLSHDSVHFITPVTAHKIVKDFVKTSGPEGDGIDLFFFDLELAPYLKVKFTETSTTDSITVTAILAAG